MSVSQAGSRITVQPWHQACRLREDVRRPDLSLDEFAADLHAVRMNAGPELYRDPIAFFARTYPTYNLRSLVADVLRRLAGQGGKPVLWLQLAYGGGKTHSLITLLHLAERGSELQGQTTVAEFLNFAGLSEAPRARVAVLPCDKFDLTHGLEVRGPDGNRRTVHSLWGALAYQLGGDAGYARVAQHEAEWISPAEPVLAELLAIPAAQGLGSLVLADEIVWYGREAVKQDQRRLGVLKDFFQVLTQAVARTERCAMVAALVSSKVEAHDSLGTAVLQTLEGIFGRMAQSSEPVAREDVAEILRRRLFEQVADERIRRAATDAFFAKLHQLPVRPDQRDQRAYDRMLASYPFHADLIDVLYQKWSQLPQDRFQRARGALRLMALALRDAEGRDPSPWVGPGALLFPGPTYSPALDELASVTVEGTAVWAGILTGERSRAAEVTANYPTLRQQEVEQALVATFLHSQPAGQSAAPADLWALLCHPGLDATALEEALRDWRRRSWFLADDPNVWRLTTLQNLNAMHLAAMERVPTSEVEAELRRLVSESEGLGVADPGVQVHVLPKGPSDVKDKVQLRYLVLGPEHATAPGAEPTGETAAFWNETSPGSPRTYKNALVGVAPDPQRLAGLRAQVRRVRGWKALLDSEEFKKTATDAQKREARRLAEAEEAQLGDAVLGCYTTVLALDEKGRLQARPLPAGRGPIFQRLKELLSSEDRLLVFRVDPAELLPGSALALWAEGEVRKPVRHLVAPFYQFARLPRLLTPEVITESVRAGVADGTFCLRLPRPDGSEEVLWRTSPSDEQLQRDDAELVPLAQAILFRLRPELLLPDALPGLWPGSGGPSLATVAAYFDGQRAPRLAPGVLDAAVAAAVKEGLVALQAGGRIYIAEEPPQPWPVDAVLTHAPEPLHLADLLPRSLPTAWREDGVTTLRTLAQALARARGGEVPWAILQRAIGSALQQRQLQLEPQSGPFPCPPEEAEHVIIGLPEIEQLAAADVITGPAEAAWRSGRASLGDIRQAIAGDSRRLPLAVLHAAVREALERGLVELGDGDLPTEPTEEMLKVVLRRPTGIIAVDGVLSPRELQALAEVWPQLQRAAPQASLECYCTVTIRGEVDAELRRQLRALLARVKTEWEAS